MNKAITDGADLMPPPFAGGLDVWSSEDGTPGSATYDGATNAALVTGDSDFGGCLELQKNDSTQKLRHMGETPLLPGCYLRVTAKVKAVSGNLPSVQIAAWAGASGGAHVTGLIEVGPSVALTTYGEVVEVTAIIGAGNRTGVDMVWGIEPIYGHFGLDLTGANGGLVRIEDIEIEDATHVFHRNLMDWVDVRDFGAIGDGVADDTAAFAAADTAAVGRTVFVSSGTYYLGSSTTINAKARFEGTVTMPDAALFSLTQNFDLPTYIEAFGDEVVAFKKAVQALFNFSDHESLDMGGRRIEIDGPIDVHAAVVNKDTYANRRVIRNGQLNAQDNPNWDAEVFISAADYAAGSPTTLSNVVNVAQIPVGSLVTGSGVGREVYVKSTNVGAATITLNEPLYGPAATQSYTFTRFKYLLDFSGFTTIQRFVISEVEFLCGGYSSGLMLPLGGLAFHIRDCFFTKPKNRGITSIGTGCAGLLLDRNQFLSNEQAEDVQDRITIGYNVNENDAKIRDNRAVRFKHFGVMNGAGHMILGNHFFQGDSVTGGQRTAGIVLTYNHCKTTITGNYVDNSSIEWTNEHDATPDNITGFSFGALTIGGNIFTSSGSASWFRFLRLKPYGTGHYIHGLNITGNTFKHISGGTLERVDIADETIAAFDKTKARNIEVAGNTFNNIDERIINPVTIELSEGSATQVWSHDVVAHLPFGGRALTVTSVLPEGEIKNGSNNGIYTLPYADVAQGAGGTEIELHWSEAVKGTAQCTVRVDKPT